MIDIQALAQPITQLLTSFGSGVLPSGSPADALRLSSAAIDSTHSLGRSGISELGAAWSGNASDAAVAKATAAQGSAVDISDRGNSIADVVGQASADVNAGMVELEGILQSFISIAVAAGPALVTPPGQMMIIGAAIEHLGRALAVVAKVRAQLTTHTAAMTEVTPQAQVPTEARPASTTPASFSGPATQAASSSAPANFVSGMSQSSGSGISSLMSPISSMASSGGSRSNSSASGATRPGAGAGEHALNGEGVKVTLPDGSTAIAPNEKAATAVRAALTQQGVPYVWGGTSPGEGLDCSGLTKYAYGEAGVDLPRLAQEQGSGHTPVDSGDLMPGDLAVWDGHVAMVIGNGQLVEAGDPVQVGPIRTSNSGMEFYGFYRPTE